MNEQKNQERRRFPRIPSRLNEHEVAAIRKMKQDDPDITPQELATRFRVSISHMRNILNGLSWRPREDGSSVQDDRRRYSRIPSRLTPEEVETIRRLKQENPRLTARELAVRFKVSATHIYDIWKGRTWRSGSQP
ncbi:MAG TPA: helix-turn-helix domain-containing protein [Candidatus Paceibacterota bacterium]|nr:helix-turn-helix domain-containing protein [Candidatus Paceibacterota bacterium]